MIKNPTNKNLPDPEKIVIYDQIYALTVSPPPDDDTFPSQLQDHFRVIEKWLKECKWQLVPEISKTGRLHYHGTVQFTTPFSIYTFYRYQPEWHFELDTIAHPDVWVSYCTKSQLWMKPQCERHAVPYMITDQNVIEVIPLDYLPEMKHKSNIITPGRRSRTANAVATQKARSTL